jgi:hypothetical protein
MSLEDPRQRTRTYLLTYLNPSAYPAMGHIYWDDGETEAAYACMYAKPNIPLKLLYYGNKNYDVIYTIGEPDNTPIRDYQHKTIGYQENVPITICAVDKDGFTAQLALWQAELKLRKIVETYFTGNLRTLRRTKPNQQYLGGFFEYTVECEIGYLRSTDTVPTYPTVTWGTSTGTYVIPNIISLDILPTSNNVRTITPGRVGNNTQKMGLNDCQIKMTCNLDVEPEDCTWKRPQTTLPKTDVIKWQVFYDIYFNGQIDEPYQTLNLGWGGTVPVILDEPHVRLEGDTHLLDLTFYTLSSTAGTAYKTWFGINP